MNLSEKILYNLLPSSNHRFEVQIIGAEGPKPTPFKPLVQSFPVREVIVDAASASPELILVSASKGIHPIQLNNVRFYVS